MQARYRKTVLLRTLSFVSTIIICLAGNDGTNTNGSSDSSVPGELDETTASSTTSSNFIYFNEKHPISAIIIVASTQNNSENDLDSAV